MTGNPLGHRIRLRQPYKTPKAVGVRSSFPVLFEETPDAAWGISRHLNTDIEDDHAYWGAARDRIAAAEDDGLAGHLGPLERRAPVNAGQWRIPLPAHMCLIRTVQAYSQAPADELAAYEANLRPQYERRSGTSSITQSSHGASAPAW